MDVDQQATASRTAGAPPRNAESAATEVTCTAIGANPDERPNILFVPQCACPRCRPDPVEAPTESGRWLRVSGRRDRPAVTPVELGPLGRSLLG